MAKIVYNACYGGFGLSEKAVQRYSDLAGLGLTFHKKYVIGHWEFPNGDWWDEKDLSRSDHILVQVVEELGEEANGMCARLEIEELPAGTLYRIDEYDGLETVATQDGYKWSVA
jgi:hypothetical protein